MYFIPLNQLESVELVIHALRAAGGQVDCSQCPAYKVCTRQCLSIADAVARLSSEGNLPMFGEPVNQGAGDDSDPPEPPAGGDGGGGHLKVVK